MEVHTTRQYYAASFATIHRIFGISSRVFGVFTQNTINESTRNSSRNSAWQLFSRALCKDILSPRSILCPGAWTVTTEQRFRDEMMKVRVRCRNRGQNHGSCSTSSGKKNTGAGTRQRCRSNANSRYSSRSIKYVDGKNHKTCEWQKPRAIKRLPPWAGTAVGYSFLLSDIDEMPIEV